MLKGALGYWLSYLGLPLLLGSMASLTYAPEPPPQRKVDFTREILPIFKASCYPCHGPERRQGGLRLSNREEAFKGGISGPAIIPGDAENSLLVKRISSDELGPRMPKGMTALPPEQIELIKRWINEGAEWPENAENIVHWSFVPPQRPPIPEVKNKAWVRNPIDAFILHRLEQEGLSPSPEAPKEVLIRRVYLDLIGLPPSPEEVEAFLKDKRPDAYERLVDRLLASPHYGEHQARKWLDLARYADTDGLEKDLRRSIWRYRDWVIDAFNRDMPFDQFTIEQLAGDLLPNPTLAQRIATGFHRNTIQNLEGGVDQEEAHLEKLYDRVETTGTVWLGLTLNCARCHDHKYDPIAQKEYFQLLAFFNNSKIYPVGDASVGEEKWLEAQIKAPTPEQERELARLERRISELRQRYPNPPTWQTASVVSVQAEQGTQFEVQSDGTILAKGETPDSDVYHLRLSAPLRRITALKIEALPSEQLPNGGSGRADSGNFVLVGATLRVNGQTVPIESAIASFSQDGFDPATVLQEGNKSNGWAVHPRVKEPHELWLILKRPLTLNAPTLQRAPSQATRALTTMKPRSAEPTLELSLRFDSERWKKHSLGHFRISLTDSNAVAVRRAEDALRRYEASLPTTLVMEDNPTDKPLTAVVRIRGMFTNRGETVSAGTPAVLHPFPDDLPRNRLGLAKWLVSPNNPLVARVQVNRMWEMCFGRGIVETSENFGTQGAFPTHPELLDWLAVEFMERGWRLKPIYRLIVTSATYRQSSRVTPELLERDPLNTLYARAPRYRLDAEVIRDNALTIGGLLSRKVGGPSVFPHQPEGVWNVPYNADRWVTSEGEDRYRRGLYTFWRRSAPYPSFIAFDANSREVCTARRPRTNTPLQALVLLNDPVYIECAQGLARRMLKAGKGDLERGIRFGFRACTARLPNPAETEHLVRFYHQMVERYRKDLDATRKLTGTDDPTLAGWVMVAHVLLNLDETISKE